LATPWPGFWVHLNQNRDLPASQQFVWTIPGWARAIPSLVD
jgi:hypothetical protein